MANFPCASAIRIMPTLVMLIFTTYVFNHCYAITFVSHHCELHPCFFQHPQAFSLPAVLHVTEVEAGDKDPKSEVGCPHQELGQSEGAVGTGWPGAEPGNGVAEPFLSSSSMSPQTRAQSSQVAQEQHLCRQEKPIWVYDCYFPPIPWTNFSQPAFLTSTWQPLRLRRCPKSKVKVSGPTRLLITKQRYVSHRPFAQRIFL